MENKDEIRLKTVRRVDQHVVQIVDSASRTALYSFDKDTESWSKTEVEGTLMIYSREAPPYNMIIIINRLNKTDFMEPLTSSCEIEVTSPFILLRMCKGPIYGFWFSCIDDVHRISYTIRQITQNAQQAPQPAPNIMNPVSMVIRGTGGGDIMTMLSRAHGDFENKRHEQSSIATTTASASNNDLVKPCPLRANEASNTNVADFFAKVGMSSMTGPPLSSPSSAGTTVIPSVTTTNPVLQKLFQGAAAVGGQASVGVSVGSAPIPISGAPIQTHSSTGSASVPSTTAPMSLEELEGKLKEDLHVTQFKDESSPIFKSHTSQQAQGVPSLLSPHVFTTSNFMDRNGGVTLIREPSIPFNTTTTTNYPTIISGPNLGMEMPPLNGSRESVQDGQQNAGNTQFQPNITPLTHEQLVQAFSILLKKNDFVQQLHEAYVQALNQSLKGCL